MTVKPTRSAAPEGIVIKAAEGAHRGAPWDGSISGDALDAQMIILFLCHDDVGSGPKLHVHPYEEVFIVTEGRARFTVGADTFVVEAGDVVKGPAAVPHAYQNLGPGRLRTIDIHLSRTWIQTDL